jgi:hypothetical protein
MASTPGAEDAHRLDKFFAGTGEGVGDLGRRGVRDPASDDAVSFKLAELGGQHFLADAQEKLAKFGEAFRAEAQMPDGENLPFAADGIDGSLHRAIVMIFHGPSRLTKMCVLPVSAPLLYHSTELPIPGERGCQAGTARAPDPHR